MVVAVTLFFRPVIQLCQSKVSKSVSKTYFYFILDFQQRKRYLIGMQKVTVLIYRLTDPIYR